jgi:two-component system chemotaxis response regulator CheY
MARKRVLTVGHCDADHGNLCRMLGRFDVEIIQSGTGDEAIRHLTASEFDLVLVNRVFDGDGAFGIDWIRRVKSDEQLKHVPIMLVSNFEHAQADAVTLGAIRGFGKSALNDAAAIACLEAVLGPPLTAKTAVAGRRRRPDNEVEG